MSINDSFGPQVGMEWQKSDCLLRNKDHFIDFFDYLDFVLIFVNVQSLSCVWVFATPWILGRQVPLSFAISQSFLKLVSIESVMPSNHLFLCLPLLFPASIFPSITVFSSESVLHIRWPKYWSFSFSISPSNENSGLISFQIDWFHLFAVQGTLESLLQRHNLKAFRFT